MGKWSSLKDKYPKLPVDADWAAKVETILNSPAPPHVLSPVEAKKNLSIRDLSDFQIAKLLNEARDAYDELEAKKKICGWDIEALEKLLIDRYEDDNETSKTFEGGVCFSLTDEPLPQVKEKDKLYTWLESNGGNREDVLQFSASKMSALVKGCLAEGKPLPDGTDVFMRTSLRRTFKK